jgi:hypothetical protein
VTCRRARDVRLQRASGNGRRCYESVVRPAKSRRTRCSRVGELSRRSGLSAPCGADDLALFFVVARRTRLPAHGVILAPGITTVYRISARSSDSS